MKNIVLKTLLQAKERFINSTCLKNCAVRTFSCGKFYDNPIWFGLDRGFKRDILIVSIVKTIFRLMR